MVTKLRPMARTVDKNLATLVVVSRMKERDYYLPDTMGTLTLTTQL